MQHSMPASTITYTALRLIHSKFNSMAVKTLPKFDSYVLETYLDDLRELKMMVYDVFRHQPELLANVWEGVTKGECVFECVRSQNVGQLSFLMEISDRMRCPPHPPWRTSRVIFNGMCLLVSKLEMTNVCCETSPAEMLQSTNG